MFEQKEQYEQESRKAADWGGHRLEGQRTERNREAGKVSKSKAL